MLTKSGIFSLSVLIVCLIGSFFQINEVSNKYFAYTTDTKVSIKDQMLISTPELSACFRIADILKRDLMKKELGLDLIQRPVTTADWKKYAYQTDNFTVRQLMRFTPGVDELISTGVSKSSDESCIIRFPRSDSGSSFRTDKECYQHLSIRRYHHRSAICYEISPKFNDSTLHGDDYLMKTDAGNFYGFIFYMAFNDRYFNHARQIAAYVHQATSVHLADSQLATTFTIPKPEIALRVSYQALRIQKLEPPYDTKCGNYPLGSSKSDQIYKSVQKEVVKTLNRSLSQIMIYDALDTPILEQNETLRRIYRAILENKTRNMPHTCCHIYTIPKVYTIANPTLGITLMWPNGLHISTESRTKLELIDYIIYVCSCIGIWFGLSAYGVFDLIKGLKKTRGTGALLLALHRKESPMEEMMGRVMNRLMRVEVFMNQFQSQERYGEIRTKY